MAGRANLVARLHHKVVDGVVLDHLPLLLSETVVWSQWSGGWCLNGRLPLLLSETASVVWRDVA